MAHALYEDAFCDSRGQSRNKINFRSGGWRDALPFVSGRERPGYQRRRGTRRWAGRGQAGPHSIGSRFICRINVGEVFLMADNSGPDSDLRNVLSLDVVYNSGGIDVANKTDTHLSPLFPHPFSFSSQQGLTSLPPNFFPSFFSSFSLSFLFLTYRHRRRDLHDLILDDYPNWMQPGNFLFRCIFGNKLFDVLSDDALCLIS